MAQSIDIGRLTLRFSGRPPSDAARLARLIADKLALAPMGGAARHTIDMLNVQHTSKPGASDEILASELAEAILRELERTI
jgi:hypothetical protein